MSEFQDTGPAEADRLPAALSFVRAYYAGARLAARHRPGDLHSQQRAEEAWQEYMKAVGGEGQISALMPGDLQGE